MNTIGRIVRNTSVIMFGDISFRVLSIFITIYLARYLGVTEFGKFSLVFVHITLFETLGRYGLGSILVRETARDESTAPQLLGNAYLLSLIFTFLAMALSILSVKVMSYSEDVTTYIYILTLIIFFNIFSRFYSTIFQAKLRMEYNAFAKVISKVISLILIFWIIFSRGTLAQVFIVLVFSGAIKMSISYYYSRKFLRLQYHIDFKQLKYLIIQGFPLAISQILLIIHFRIDVIMLSKIVGDAAVGIYSASYRLSEPLMLIPYAFVASIFPVMSHYSGSKKKLTKIFWLSFKYLLILALPIVVGVTLIADKIILLLYGASFADSTKVLSILIWGFLIMSLNTMMLSCMTSINKQHLSTISYALGAIGSVILNLLLIPSLGYVGASYANVAAKLLIFGLSFYFVIKNLDFIPVHRLFIKPALSSLVMGIFIYYFSSLDVLLLVPLSAIVYIISLFTLRTISAEEITRIKYGISKKF